MLGFHLKKTQMHTAHTTQAEETGTHSSHYPGREGWPALPIAHTIPAQALLLSGLQLLKEERRIYILKSLFPVWS